MIESVKLVFAAGYKFKFRTHSFNNLSATSGLDDTYVINKWVRNFVCTFLVVQEVVHFETAVPTTYNVVRISPTGERSEEITGATVDGNSSKCK